MKTRVFLALILAVILVVSSTYAARVFIFLHSKGTGTNPQEVFTQAVESQKCPSPYTYDSGRKVCVASPSCPSGGELSMELGKCVVAGSYTCSLNGATYGNQDSCSQACSETAACYQMSLQLNQSPSNFVYSIDGAGDRLNFRNVDGTVLYYVTFPSYVTLSGYHKCCRSSGSCDDIPIKLKVEGNRIVIRQCKYYSPTGPGITMTNAYGEGEVDCSETGISSCNPPCQVGSDDIRFPAVISGNALGFSTYCTNGGSKVKKSCCSTLRFYSSVGCPFGNYPCEGNTNPTYCTREGQCSLTCQSPYAPEGDTCVANPLCPLSGTYNASTGRCEIALR